MMPFAVAAAACLLFLPVVSFDFVNWDDPRLIVNNPYFRGFGPRQMAWMFTTLHGEQYHPLTWMTFALDHVLWGLRPAGYHLSNLFLHTANAVLFYFLARRLLALASGVRSGGGKRDYALDAAAGFAGLFFALHPLRVESVAWVTERRGLLCAFFYLAALLAYLRAVAESGAPSPASAMDGRRRWLIAAVVLTACALLSKPMAVSIPLVLAVLDVYPLRRVGGSVGWLTPAAWRVWREKTPFLALALAAAIVAPLGQTEAIKPRPLVARVAVSAYGLAFYPRKTLFPLSLSPLYQYEPSVPPYHWRYLASGVAVVGITFTLWQLRRRWPAGLALWMAYGATIAPVSGMVALGGHRATDRYSYIPCLTWALLAGGAVLYFWTRPLLRRTVAVVAGGVLLVWAALTLGQLPVWRNSCALWSRVLRLDPRVALAWNNHAGAHPLSAFPEITFQDCGRALALRRNYPEAIVNRGAVFMLKGDLDEAVAHFTRALQIAPNYAPAYVLRGNVYCQRRQYGRGLEDYSKALQYEPDSVPALYFRGLAYLRLKQSNRAIEDLTEAIRLAPRNPDLYHRRALAYYEAGDYAKAWDDVAACRRLGGQVDADLVENLTEVSAGRK